MFHLLSLQIHNLFLKSLKSFPLLVEKGSHSSIPIPPPNPQSNQALKELQSYF
jgi:hypothetical protein